MGGILRGFSGAISDWVSTDKSSGLTGATTPNEFVFPAVLER
jgi:hypothetical protein